ncbi:hypothetical protein HDU96_008717 [Phlyctochytrium bullatum]|nr:hypothetical protein HDU96_008717 [Phlyctochytrium bullatum]
MDTTSKSRSRSVKREPTSPSSPNYDTKMTTDLRIDIAATTTSPDAEQQPSEPAGNSKPRLSFRYEPPSFLVRCRTAIESRIGTIILVVLVALDGVLCQAQPMATLYDPQYESAVRGTGLATEVLGANGDEKWRIMRNLFFWASFGIRCLFAIEVLGIRLWGQHPFTYLSAPLNSIDVVVVLAALILKPVLSPRESLVTNPLPLLRLFHLGALIRSDHEQQLDTFRLAMEEERRLHRAAVDRERHRVKNLKRDLLSAHDKLRLLLGEETFQSEVGVSKEVEAETFPRPVSDSTSMYLLNTIKV